MKPALHQTMNATSTPSDVLAMMHFERMSLKTTRMKRLKALAEARGDLGPVELGKLIGKKPNQTSDLLTGKASFGEKVARSIEEHAALPSFWLDRDDESVSYWPFSNELLDAVHQLDRTSLEHLENVMRAHLHLSAMFVTPTLAPPPYAAAAQTVPPLLQESQINRWQIKPKPKKRKT